MTRYHPLLVVLHWLMALMILGALVAGKVLLESVPDTDPGKVSGYVNHMTLGLAIGVLLLLRLGVRLATGAPPHAATGSAALDRLGVAVHWLFYLVVAAMVVSGIATARGSGLAGIVFFGAEAPLPELDGLAARSAHGLLSTLLILLILLHVAAAAWHEAVRKDRLLARMSLGRRG